MSTLTIPNTFVTNTPADPTQVNANFNAVVNIVNGSLDDSNISSSANIQPSKVQGTAVTQSYLQSYALSNIAWNPFFIPQSGNVVPSWTLNTNATVTQNDTTVVSGVNSISDANALDTWVVQQTIGTSLNTSANAIADILLVPGKTYVVSMDVKTTSGANTVFIAVQNASSYATGNTNIQSTTTYHTGSGSYQKIYSVFTVPVSCQNITIALVKAANTTSVTVCDANINLGSSPVPAISNSHILPSGNTVIDTDILGGWTPALETWTFVDFSNGSSGGYAANGHMSTPKDVTSKYAIGDRIKFLNNGVTIYGVCTYLNYNGTITNMGYLVDVSLTVTNSAITNVYYSKLPNPVGYPFFFNYNPNYTGFSVNPSAVSEFSITGRMLTLSYTNTGNGTSNATGFTITAPNNFNGQTNSNGVFWIRARDNGSDSAGNLTLQTGTNVLGLEKTVGNGNSWTASGGKAAYFTISYRI